MRLALLAPQVPYPPRQGTAIRNWGLLKHLAPHFDLALITFAPSGALDAAGPLHAICRRVVSVPPPHRPPARRAADLLRGAADLAGRLYSADYEQALRAALGEFQPGIVQVEGLELTPYLPAIRATAPAARLVYDAHNAEHVLQRRALAADLRQPRRWLAAAYSALQAPRLARLEARVARSVDAVLCVSAEDAAALRDVASGAAPIVIPNGIDVAEYAGLDRPPVPGQPARLVFTGKMDYRPNVDAALWFAAEILPRVRAVRPGVEFHVVGQQPPAAVRRLTGRNGVVVTGAVPDARPHIAGAAVYVAPLRMGGGTRFKLLEAFAMVRPVVSTTLGAEGFPVASERELLLADDAPAFAAAILRLLSDPPLSARLGLAGQRFARTHYDWSVILPRLLEVYAGLGYPRAARIR
jgi:glycosyltransferase involved in cell wall biosynthesis